MPNEDHRWLCYFLDSRNDLREVERFLESKLNLQLATDDEQGEPISTSLFYYDKTEEKLSITKSKLPEKLKTSGT